MIEHQRTKLYDLPLTCLDYGYIENCRNRKELEKILKVLRSGTEGRYPQLEECCENKLKIIAPESYLLRKPGKLISASQLEEDERCELEIGFQDWMKSMKAKKDGLSVKNADTFDTIHENNLPPIRSVGSISSDCVQNIKRPTFKRSKPRSYEEWSKLENELDKELNDDKNESISNPTPIQVESKPIKRSNFEELSKMTAFMPINVRKSLAESEKYKGNEAYNAGDLQEALNFYNRSLAIFQTTAVMNNRALVYLNQKKWKHAVEECCRILTEESDNEKALYRRGLAYYKTHYHRKAKDDIDRLLGLYPDNIKAVELLNKIDKELVKTKCDRVEVARRMNIEEVDSSNEDEDECSDDDFSDQNCAKLVADVIKGVEIDEISDSTTGVHKPVWRREKQQINSDKIIEEKNPKEATEMVNSSSGDHKITSSIDSLNDRNIDKWVSVRDNGEIEEKGNKYICESEKCPSKLNLTPHSFKTHWFSIVSSNHKGMMRYKEIIHLLKSVEISQLASFWGDTFEAQMLEESIKALEVVSTSEGDFKFIYDVLHSLSKVPRFDVALYLVNDEACKVLENVFMMLKVSNLIDLEKLDELRGSYIKQN